MTAGGLSEALERMRAVVDLVPAAFVATDRNGLVTIWNPAAEQLFGWPAREVFGRPDPTLVREAPVDVMGTPHEVTRRRSDGTNVELTVVNQPLDDATGAASGRLSVYAGGAERRRLEVELALRTKQQAAVVRLGEVALAASSMSEVSTAAVRAVGATLGLPAVALLRATEPAGRGGRSLVTAAFEALDWASARPWVVGERASTGLLAAQRALATRQTVVEDPGPALRDDPERPDPLRPDPRDPNDPHDPNDPLRLEGIRGLAAVVVGSPAEPWGVLVATSREPGRFGRDDLWFLQAVAGVVAAADARRVAEAEVRHRAWHDALTGLPNRELLLGRMAEVLAEGRRTHRASALLLLDLDRFKDVNDSHGHQAGDRVLVQVADRVRATIGSRGLVARLGGDEFAVLLTGLSAAFEALNVAKSLVDALEPPCATPGGPARIGGSVGIALAPSQGDDPTTLLMQADLAMYRAKRERAGYAVFDSRHDHDASARLALVTELRAAIADGGVRVEYQPMVSLRSHAFIGAEALARWSSPRLGPQSPADFVALAEQGGLIEELTALVLRTAAAQAAAWRDAGLTVAVNVSPLALADDDFVDQVLACVTEHRLTPERLRLEVTESSLTSPAAVRAIERLAARDVRIALDDFGTGYSSLARLKELPVSTLKIDRSFIRNVADDTRDAALVRAIMTLARDLGLRVVAEGIETARAARSVTDLGVHLGQGLLYAPALSVPDLSVWATRWARGDWPCCAGDDPDPSGGRVIDLRPDVSPSRPT